MTTFQMIIRPAQS